MFLDFHVFSNCWNEEDVEQFNQTPQAMTAGARFDFALATQVPNTYAVDMPAVTWWERPGGCLYGGAQGDISCRTRPPVWPLHVLDTIQHKVEELQASRCVLVGLCYG